MEKLQADKILEIGIQLTAEHDYDRLLSKIIDCAMELTGCDGGTLYLYDGERLNFCVMKTRSMGIDRNGRAGSSFRRCPWMRRRFALMPRSTEDF